MYEEVKDIRYSTIPPRVNVILTQLQLIFCIVYLIVMKTQISLTDVEVLGFMINYDLLCQNPPLTHIMSKNSFHHQCIAPSINYQYTTTKC